MTNSGNTRFRITNARIVTDGAVREGDMRIRDGRIQALGDVLDGDQHETVIDAEGRYLLPGMIDDQVHFREPGLTRKGDIASESAAAAAGGITSFMEMPNTDPPTTTRDELAAKFERARDRAVANYSFYFGASNDNLEEIRQLGASEACGIKVFMGASTGNMLVDNPDTLAGIFREAPCVVSTHCEDTPMIQAAHAAARKRYPDGIPPAAHPDIRSRQACLKSSTLAVSLARRYGTQLHVLHLTTADELALFEVGPVAGKSITVEACVHHLLLSDADYAGLGNLIKCNPAIKTDGDRDALRAALAEDRIDIVATDHAPHLLSEKGPEYDQAAAGMPLVEFALCAAWELVADGVLTPAQLADKTAHNPARRFRVADRGFIREGARADLVLLNPDAETVVDDRAILSRCGWTPFRGRRFRSRIDATWVNGQLVWHGGKLTGLIPGERLEFDR